MQQHRLALVLITLAARRGARLRRRCRRRLRRRRQRRGAPAHSADVSFLCYESPEDDRSALNLWMTTTHQ
jgi:hypothetical protein